MSRVVAFAAVLSLLASGCGHEKRIQIVVRTHEGAPISNTKLDVRRFGFVSSQQTKVGEVTTNDEGVATYSFSTSRDYSVWLDYKACEYVGGSFVLTGEEIATGVPMEIHLHKPVCPERADTPGAK